METRTKQMKPEIQKAITFVDGNREYLQEQGIFEGSQTLKGKLENFYDLKYHTETYMVATRAMASFDVLGVGREDKTKYGRTPKELLDVLYTIHPSERELDIPVDYELVRESFNKTLFPAGKTAINIGMGLVGMIGGAFSGIYSLASCTADNADPSVLTWSIPLTIGLWGLGAWMPFKNANDGRKFEKEMLSTLPGKTNKLFWDLHGTAQTADSYVTKYKDLFGEK